MGLVKEIHDDVQFQTEMSAAGSKLVVADFSATWCVPCHRIAPVFESLAMKYPSALFIKVDVDKCQETAASQNITAMPTFIFYRFRIPIDRLQGADPITLESKIKQHYIDEDEEGGNDMCEVAGHMDLSAFIARNECECLNESDSHPFPNTQNASSSYLESDCDEQLIISVNFTQSVKLHSIKIKAPEAQGPKTVKVFINQPRLLDFDLAESSVPVQELVLDKSDLDGGPINLRYVKFQNVHNVQLFIKDNQTGAETTIIETLGFIGSPISTTRMGDFKRIGGRKGEGHESYSPH
ncbi:UNVERIFIED_CONTAM: hypothetical protein PYX00_010082 [Menopon gallinae]|uniref:Thioredoxin-like protein 1 n=1 Tax=Menopon gallinae TaxID=328185 RepID=A0AAW2HE33_9NEOP